MKRLTVTIMMPIVILLGMSLACSFSVSLKNPTPTPSPTEVPLTNTPIPLPPTPVPTDTLQAPVKEAPPVVTESQSPQGGVLNPDASSSGDIYYADAFENLDNWTNYVLKGTDADVNFSVFDNRLRTEINAQDTWLYYLFEGGEFSDIRIDLQVENRASNTNYVGMLCRYSENGWYEANILNTGEYYVFYSTGDADGNELSTIYKGASRFIRTGQKVNDYTVICRGDLMTIYINGSEVVSIPLRTGDFRFLPEGKAGLSVSTTHAIPVVVDFLQFILSVP